MGLRCVAVLAGLFACLMAGEAAAQVPMTGNLPTFDTAPPAPAPGASAPAMVAPPPGMPPPGGPPGGFAGPPPGGQEPPCMKEFLPLKEAAEKRAGLIKSAADRKAPRPEVCQLFKNFAVAEAKVVKFVADKQVACHVPPQAVSQMKANHERTLKTRDQICAAGAAGGPAGPPPGPRLSDELGIRGVAGPGTTTRGRGTFDTLTGSPLGR
jgi:hypothetical protein